MEPSDVDAVILNYNSAILAQRAAQSAHDNGVASITVIDNCSEDESVPLLQEKLGGFCNILIMPENVGFAKAMNLGAEKGKNPIILFLNADVTLHQGAIESLVHEFDVDRRIGAVGPRLYYPDGGSQASAYLFPTPFRILMQMVGLDKVAKRLQCSLIAGVEDPIRNSNYTGEVESLYGACFAVRRSAFEEMGGFDESYFLYFEETDLFFRLTKANWQIARVAKAKATHHHGASSQSASFNTLITMQESRWYYANKYFNHPQRVSVILISITGLFIRVLLSKESLARRRYASALAWWLRRRP